MMRYQRVSPDCLPLANGRKPNLRTCKDDDHTENGRIPNFSNFEGKSLRVRSGSNPSTSQQETHHFPHFALSDSPAHSENHVTAKNLTHEIGGGGSSGSPGRGDVLLQWGHNKRSRGSRTGGDESSGHGRPASKIQRRGTSSGAVDKQAMTSMPPPPPCAGYSRGANLRPCMPPIRDSTGSLLNRAVEERSGGHPRPEKRSPPSPPEKAQKMAMGCSIPTANGGSTAPQADPTNHLPSTPSSEQEAGGGSGCGAAPAGTTEKLNMDLFEWPRIYINLSRKEKEDDFLAMKGSKLPQRPKKRAKNVDKTLQYCFPGMWLSDLTRGRYEVREKKCVKKKRRGLKGMESMDSESE